MKILAIDPAPFNIGYVTWDSETSHFLLPKFGIKNVEEFIVELDSIVKTAKIEVIAIEMTQSYGGIFGNSLIATVLVIGRIIQQIINTSNLKFKLFSRPSIKAKIGGKNDKEIKASLERRFGKKEKGAKLDGVSKDVWAALAVAVAYSENTLLKEWAYNPKKRKK